MKIRFFKFEEDLFFKNAQRISKYHHEVLLIKKFLQTEPRSKKMIISYYDLYYTVIKNRDEEEIVSDKYENIENDFINIRDLVTPKPYIGIEPRGKILRSVMNENESK